MRSGDPPDLPPRTRSHRGTRLRRLSRVLLVRHARTATEIPRVPARCSKPTSSRVTQAASGRAVQARFALLRRWRWWFHGRGRRGGRARCRRGRGGRRSGARAGALYRDTSASGKAQQHSADAKAASRHRHALRPEPPGPGSPIDNAQYAVSFIRTLAGLKRYRASQTRPMQI